MAEQGRLFSPRSPDRITASLEELRNGVRRGAAEAGGRKALRQWTNEGRSAVRTLLWGSRHLQ